MGNDKRDDEIIDNEIIEIVSNSKTVSASCKTHPAKPKLFGKHKFSIKSKPFLTTIFLLCLLTEFILRVIGFYYVPEEIGLKVTPEYNVFEVDGEDYVTKANKQMYFYDQRFPVIKSNKVIRIFIFGGASIYDLGDMEFLKECLNNVRDGKFKRLINMGGNSYGTTRELLCMHEILRYDPDVIIIYSGNNEFQEKFLEGRYFSNSQLEERFVFAGLNKVNDILVGKLRIYQFSYLGVQKIIELALGHPARMGAKGKLLYFPPDCKVNSGMNVSEVHRSIRYNRKVAFKRYEDNINRMIDLAKIKNIKIALCTVSYNRMRPPFKSANDDYDKGMSLYKEDRFKEAAVLLERGLDSDLEPHRASNLLNYTIKKICKARKVPLIDVDKEFVALSGNGIPGYDLFFDHCHLNEKGNIILQKILFKAIKDNRMLNK